MPTTVGVAYVDVRPDVSNFGRELRSEVGNSAEPAGREAGSKMAGGFKKAAGALAGAFAAVQVGGFLKDTVSAASDLGESLSKVGVVFGEQAGEIEKFAASAARNLGISKQAALEATGTLGNLFVSMGLGADETADLSTNMVTLASDLASFNNASPEETLQALRSGLLGETEPLKRFGVNLNAARIQAEGFAAGIIEPAQNMELINAARVKVEKSIAAVAKAEKEHGKGSDEVTLALEKQAKAEGALAKALEGSKVEMTAAQKAQAAYSLIMKDTKTAQGDFGRTSDGLANQQRILAAQFEDVKTRIGSALLPVVLRATTFFTTNLIPTFNSVVNAVRPIIDVIGSFVSSFRSGETGIGESAGKLSAVIQSVKETFSSAFAAVEAVVTKAVEILTTLWTAFGDDILSFIRETWANVQEVFRGAFNFISGIFDLVKAILTGKWGEAWEAVKKILDGAWDTIFGVVRNAVTNVIPTIFGLAVDTIGQAFKAIWNGFATFVDTIWDGIFTAVSNGWGVIERFFTETVPRKMGEAAGALFGWIPDAFKAAMNALIGIWNKADLTFPRIEVPDWVPGIGGKGFGGFDVFPDFPELADGGVVMRDSLIRAGEAGPEAVLPLSQLPRVLAPLRSLDGATGAGPVQFENHFHGTDLSARDVADEIGWLLRTTGR